MSEIKKEIKPNADGSFTITDAHSTSDIVRWLLTQDSKETILYLLNEGLAQPEQELLAWKNAALRVGEDLSSVGPKGYYNMTAQQWLDWAMAQQPRGNNSLAQPEQEFVAYIDMSEWPPVRFKEGTLRCDIAHLDGQKLYTTPPQRTWVGLTEAQCGVLWKTNMTPFEYYQAIEAKLKEKNT